MKILAFYLKTILLALPFALVIAFYVWVDPFMVIRNYNDYDSPIVMQSEGTVGWKKYKMFRHIRHYDSFIMGSSCTKAFNTADWLQYINGSPFRFFGNAEGLADMCLKLEALDRQPGQKIRNLLIVGEVDFLSRGLPQKGATYSVPPEVSGQSWIAYQTTHLQAFFALKFLKKYLRYRVTHRYTDDMNGVINNHGRLRTRFTNDAIPYAEPLIHKQGERFWQTPEWLSARAENYVFTERKPVIFHAQLACLLRIKRICDKHHTNLKIAIGPAYKTGAVNHTDIELLKKIFGQYNVVDYSDRAHIAFTDYHYFSDPAHYRNRVGRLILHDLYRAHI